jgi:AhpD family alkylhydroperoxidase
MGFLPTSMMTMAHWPELTQAFGGLGATVLNSGELDAGLKQMIALAVSNAAGCRYCQAHTANSAQKNSSPDLSYTIVCIRVQWNHSDLSGYAPRVGCWLGGY